MRRIYRITRPNPGAGFFSNWFWYLGHVVKHKKLNQECFIDTLSQNNLYNSNFFFEKKLGYWDKIYDQAKFGKDIKILDSNSSSYPKEHVPKNVIGEDVIYSKSRINEFKKAITTHALIKEKIKQNFQQKYCRYLDKKILGIQYRATDKFKSKPGHLKNNDLSDYLKIAKEIKEKKKYELIFLATDNNFAVEKFLEIFEENVIYSQAMRKSNQYTSRGIHDSRFNKVLNLFSNHGHKMALDVLEDAYVLSKCSGLICGHSNVSDAAICMKNSNFDDLELVGNGNIIFEE